MAPVTHTDRYNDSVDFWRNVYGINSEYLLTIYGIRDCYGDLEISTCADLKLDFAYFSVIRLRNEYCQVLYICSYCNLAISSKLVFNIYFNFFYYSLFTFIHYFLFNCKRRNNI